MTADIRSERRSGCRRTRACWLSCNRINASIGVTTAQGGEVAVRDTLIKLLPDTANPSYSSVGLYSDIFLSSNTTATIDAKNVTIVGGNSPNDIGVWSIASSSGGPIVDASLSSSILADVETSLKHTGSPRRGHTRGRVLGLRSGDDQLDQLRGQRDPHPGPGNVNLAPGFVDAAGGELLAGVLTHR